MIYVPHVPGLLHPKTRSFAERVGATMLPLDADDPHAYWLALARLWGSDETFAIVEQDVVPTAGVVRRMVACNAVWCGAPTKIGHGAPMIALGCTKFDRGILRMEPDLLDEPLNWWQIDGHISKVLRAKGYAPHEHWPPAKHLNPGHA